ncbi:MAG TPA: DeoR/GlpR family DNA-binding transcription regulator, partial [Acidimicrobiia bacterium]|nr:DeoR/GlpR family DNA-binding transcription regulator [Acidimicrobiia bacterium]
RRDLAHLQDQKLVRRVHGGAVPWEGLRYEPLLKVRGGLYPEEKHRIGKRALDELPSEGSILLDSGSTSAHLAQLLPQDRDLTVVTNSIPVAQALETNEAMEVVLIGGTLRKNTMALVDATGVDALSKIVVDVTFLCTDGASPKKGFTTPYTEEVAIKRAMISSARRVVALFDHSKVGNDRLHWFASIDEVDTIITDNGVSDEVASAFADLGPLVVRA